MDLLAIPENTEVIGVSLPVDKGGYTFAEGTRLVRKQGFMDDSGSVMFRITSGAVHDELGSYGVGEDVFLDEDDFVLAE
jgi:hypothetical protein